MKPFRDKVIDVLTLIFLVSIVCFGLSALGPEGLQVQVEKLSDGLLPPGSVEAGLLSSRETALSRPDTLKEVPMIDEQRVVQTKKDSSSILGEDLAIELNPDSTIHSDSLVADSLTFDSLQNSLPNLDSFDSQKADSIAS